MARRGVPIPGVFYQARPGQPRPSQRVTAADQVGLVEGRGRSTVAAGVNSTVVGTSPATRPRSTDETVVAIEVDG
ncbi:hypothetical protein HBB16_10570 [Pseudonocardia sp. MCCB 268]|nr:hypothetical protein [Pseudonocardia cytotoxica]